MTTVELSEYDHGRFDILADFYETTKVALIRQWINRERQELIKQGVSPFEEAEILRRERFEARQKESYSL